MKPHDFPALQMRRISTSSGFILDATYEERIRKATQLVADTQAQIIALAEAQKEKRREYGRRYYARSMGR